ncbi:MAG: transglutaminase family protein, partial [Anaerolineales bacterium]|nr:transglutaminase family protein [Anaerolineales bacterium]
MNKQSWLYKVTASMVSLAMFLQVVLPVFALPSPQPVQADETLTVLRETAVAANAPDTLARPLAITRAQSSYQAGGDITVTYTVQNNLSATYFPDIDAGLNVTETVAALAGYNPLDDPYTLRGVIVSTELSNGAAFLDASVWPDTDGSQLLFSLGDIAPSTSATFTVTLSTPASAADFIELDGGTAAYGTLQGRMATAVSPPIRLAPDGFANWLISTADATRDDEAMLFQLAELDDNPVALFEYVQALGYEAYDGSLRGTRGTLWSAAGNSADQSSLLIAMLRGAGYPARYRHGALSQADAQTLLASMFPTPQAVRGYVPATAAVGNPVNDPDLLALAEDHWWVEAYLPGSGWIDLDPTMPTSVPGDVFATPAQDGTDKISELPDAIR